MSAVLDGQYIIDGGAAGEIEAVSASDVKKDDKITTAVVNRDFSEGILLAIPFNAECTVCSAEPDGTNTLDRNCTDISTVRCTAGGSIILPPCAFAIIHEI